MCLFGGSKSPPPLPAPVTPPPLIDPTKDNVRSTQARSDEQKRASLAQGNKSLISSSPLGVQDPAVTKKASLLGETA